MRKSGGFRRWKNCWKNKISRRFKVRRLDKDDFGYLIEHLYGQTGTAYEDYEVLPAEETVSGGNAGEIL